MIKHPVSSEAAQDFIDNVYQDRGMMKWQGFMLSDHKAAMNKANNKPPTRLDQQPRQKILQMLKESYEKKKSVILQSTFLQNGFPYEVKGFVVHISEDEIYIKGNNDPFEIEAIRNIRYK